MGVSNRSRQTAYYGDRNKGWNFVRGAFALLALIGISFLFGFFVLARLMPDTRATSNGIPATTAIDNAQSIPPPQTSQPAATVHTEPKRESASPTLEPEPDETVQKPATPDNSGANTLPSTADAAAKDKTDENKTGPNSSSPFVPAEQLKSNGEPVQSPSELDAKRTGRRERERRREQPDNTAHTDTASPASAASSSLYRVQVGVFSTKEAAEQEAARVRERGFDATIHTTTEGGRTLYQIQNGVYRNRANAEAQQQRLKEAGIDTHVAEIGGGAANKP